MTEQYQETFAMLESWSDPKRPRPVNFMSQDYLERLSKFVAVVKSQQQLIDTQEARIARLESIAAELAPGSEEKQAMAVAADVLDTPASRPDQKKRKS